MKWLVVLLGLALSSCVQATSFVLGACPVVSYTNCSSSSRVIPFLPHDSAHATGLSLTASSALQPAYGPSAHQKLLISFDDWKKQNVIWKDHLTKINKRQQRRRGKTADRFNYASMDCSAKVLAVNRETHGSRTILDEDRDRYMVNRCDAKEKYFIIELCDKILIDTLVMANFEMFSSVFREFDLYASSMYPATQWVHLGHFEAANSRGIQVFPIEHPHLWAKYIKVDIKSHYGSEYYCTLSLVRVHGTTMMEDYQDEMDAVNDADDEIVEPEMPTQLPSSAPKKSLLSRMQTRLWNFIMAIFGFVQADEEFEDDGTNRLPREQKAPFSSSADSSFLLVESYAKFTANPHAQTFSDVYPDPSRQQTPAETAPPSPPLDESTESTSKEPKRLQHLHVSENMHKETWEEARRAMLEENMDAPRSTLNTATIGSDSFYKNMINRLTSLEINATLAGRYLEHQSQRLLEAFSSLEWNVDQVLTGFEDQISALLDRQSSIEGAAHKEYKAVAELSVMVAELHRRLDSDEFELAIYRVIIIAQGIAFAMLCYTYWKRSRRPIARIQTDFRAQRQDITISELTQEEPPRRAQKKRRKHSAVSPLFRTEAPKLRIPENHPPHNVSPEESPNDVVAARLPTKLKKIPSGTMHSSKLSITTLREINVHS